MPITGDWDRRITRRTLLRTGGSLAAGAVLAGALAPRASAVPIDDSPFTLGVASGDPGPHSVVLWTRLATDPLVDGGGLAPQPYLVRYEAAAIGRTRTAPRPGAMVDSLRFAFVSCQNFPDGYFNAYADVIAQDLDAVAHLGDYIYEGPGPAPGSGALRTHAPGHEVVSLDDYRIRHALYKSDLDLQAAHAALPWLVTRDDHEVDNNYAGLESDPDSPPEAFALRRANAYRADWEHMPLRRARKPKGPDLNLYRRFRWGAMATFNVLDTRQHRSDQHGGCAIEELDPSGYCRGALAPERTMLGAAQRDWLFQDLATTASRWNVLAQQIALAPFDRDASETGRDFGGGDNWDGYVVERQHLLDWLVAHGTPNPIVMTGDSHQNWVRNVPPDHRSYDAPPVATEFMCTSVSTNGDPAAPFVRFQDDPNNPHITFRNNRCRSRRRRPDAGQTTPSVRPVSSVSVRTWSRQIWSPR